jgi:hypothetical protein
MIRLIEARISAIEASFGAASPAWPSVVERGVAMLIVRIYLQNKKAKGWLEKKLLASLPGWVRRRAYE